jgi:two-component response regulator (ARR-A family)
MTPTNVLIIDDSKVITKMAAKALLSNKIESHFFDKEHIHIAYDGMQAFEMLGRNPNISLVISDVMMPELTGEELIEILVDTGRMESLEVVFMTTQINKVCKQVSKHIKGIIHKPFNDESFSKLFNKLDEEHKQKIENIKKLKLQHDKQIKYINSWVNDYCETENITLNLEKLAPLIEVEFDHNHEVDEQELLMIFNSVLDNYLYENNISHNINNTKIKNIYNSWREPEKYKELGIRDELIKVIQTAQNSISEHSTNEDIRFILILPINQILSKTQKLAKVKDKLPYDDFIPFMDDLIELFESIDTNYDSTDTQLVLTHIKEIQTFYKELYDLSKRDKLIETFPELDKESEHFNAISDHMNISIKYINRQIIPFYVSKTNKVAWEHAKKSPKIVEYLKKKLKEKMINTHNMLYHSKIIDRDNMREFKKYDAEGVILVSKKLEILDLFKNTLTKELPSLNVEIYTQNSILASNLENKVYSKIVLDINYNNSIYKNGLQMIKSLRKRLPKIDALIQSGGLYILASHEQVESLRSLKDNIKYKIILKHINKKNILDKFYFAT